MRNGIDLSAVTRKPRLFMGLVLVFGAVFWAFNPFVRTVDNVDYFRLEGDPAAVFYEKFKEVFGNDEFFVIAFETTNLFTTENLEVLRNITDAMEALDEPETVRSLANVEDIVGGKDYFEVRPFLEEIPREPDALEDLRKRALGNPLYVKNLVSADGKTAAIVVEAADRPDDWDYRKRLIQKTRQVLADYEKTAGQFYLAGWTYTNLSLSQYLKKDMMVFVPVTYLFITLTVWVFFRSAALTLMAVINISACLAATRGFMGMTGVTLNNVTIVVIPLVMALALCDTVHIFSHLDRRLLDRFGGKEAALAQVIRQVVFPCFLTTLTTAVGFLSLAVSRIPPIREFAWIAAAGMFFEFIFSFFLLPPLLLMLRPEKVFRDISEAAGIGALMVRLTRWVGKWSRWVLAGAAAVIALAVWGATDLKVETNLLEFFRKNSEVRRSLSFVERRLGGVGTLDVSLHATAPDAFKDPENLEVVERIQRFIDHIQGVDKTVSVVDFLKDMNESFHAENPAFYRLPDSRQMVAQYMLIYDSDEIEDVVDPRYTHARIAVRLSEHSSRGQKVIIEKIEQFIEETAVPGMDVVVTGRAVQDVHTIEGIVNGQIKSLVVACGVISVIMLFVFRSVSLAALSMVPNFFPIVINFGIMGAAGIALDTGTALIAAVALGIAVDDTIHVLTEYQRRRTRGEAIHQAMPGAVVVKGRAVFSSSVILCIGFGVLVLSRFMPTVNFGLLSAIIMITALVGDTVVLPAMVFQGADGRWQMTDDR